jgi:hypothetical protein
MYTRLLETSFNRPRHLSRISMLTTPDPSLFGSKFLHGPRKQDYVLSAPRWSPRASSCSSVLEQMAYDDSAELGTACTWYQ